MAFVELNNEQRAAIDTIEDGSTGTSLLFGVTGSGKTEVYLTLIESHLRAGRQALVLVPEIGLTPQTIRRFTNRFSVPVTTIHSGLTDRERLDAWSAARSGQSGIVIGTRSAIFCPLKHPGILIVDEEHDGSFKQQDGFRYSARDLAVVRGQMESIPVVLGSATPSLESWQNATTGKYRKVVLTERATGATQPTYRVINLRDTIETEGFSQQLIDQIGHELGQGNQVLVFLNRRGYAPVILCRSCGWLSQCDRCDARMTFHKTMNRLICHHCGSESIIPEQCPACTSTDMVPLGAGTQRVERTLTELFAGSTVLRVDRDSTRGRHAMEELLSEIHNGEPAILVGTQLLAKGHHFPDVTLVAIADMDSGFYSGNYRAEERMAQLILQVGGRAGRAEKPGTVSIQTHLPEQPLFKRLIGQGYAAFADELLDDRRTHELPPFHHHALLRAEAQKAEAPSQFLDDILSGVTPNPSVMLLGPVPATMERKAGRYRYHLLLSSDNRKKLSRTLDQCIAAAEQSRFSRRVRWSVDVDPLELF
jgi:primosomal protein N' (replication factor Y)